MAVWRHNRAFPACRRQLHISFVQNRDLLAGIEAEEAVVVAACRDHPSARQLVAATISAEMCRRLYAGGVRQFHFYTLNRAELSYAICHLLGKRPVETAKEAAA